ncbi:hypothetical protein CCYA_CCYA18G4491 [Cyanidiococcus yangmingshanensis]|uniref:Rieske domain-containing protein n=1 Tax=Cyanidiococcus yangmingshanensis TaxID=2690220 RepID=A0A7J7ICK0_9RHOD|nr:hypothetical protein F1559_001054 [Cyanidiococcus yangmingshanensis]KAK4533609.1 hypothetical protein CCYA_CCYA18G4491 [Cyanidiococcus yangmingshanensis]
MFVATPLSVHKSQVKGRAVTCAQRARRSTGFGNLAMKEAWVRLVPSSDLQPGELRTVTVASQLVLVAVDQDGSVYASQGYCSHLAVPLDTGSIADGVLTCSQHRSSFDLKTGEVISWCTFPPILGPLLGKLQPATPISVFPVRENAGYIEAYLQVDAREDFEKQYWRGILDAQGKATGGYY